MAELLATTWRGLLLSRDELSGWLSSMDRYSGGGDRPFWLEAHGGRNYTVDRKASPEPVIVEHMSVSILGGTQPDKLDSLLVKSDDDGLLARFLTVFPGPVPLRRPTAVLDEVTPNEAFKRLSRAIAPAMAVLVEADWIAPINSATGGRPKKMYAVNPRIGETI